MALLPIVAAVLLLLVVLLAVYGGVRWLIRALAPARRPDGASPTSSAASSEGSSAAPFEGSSAAPFEGSSAAPSEGVVRSAARGRSGAVHPSATGVLDVVGERDRAGARARGRVLSWRWTGILVGAVGAYLTVALGTLGRGELLAAPIFGLGALAGTLLGELTGPRPDGTVRRAQLRVRRATDYVRPGLGLIVAGSIAAVAVLGTVTTLVASPDDLGRAGRNLACSNGETIAEATGPWPGSFYTLPGGALVLAGLLLAGLSLQRIVRRPQPAGTAAADDAMRRRSAAAAVAAAGILVLVPLFGVALTSGTALISLADNCGPAWWPAAGWALIGLSVVAFVGAVWMLAVLVLPLSHARPGAPE